MMKPTGRRRRRRPRPDLPSISKAGFLTTKELSEIACVEDRKIRRAIQDSTEPPNGVYAVGGNYILVYTGSPFAQMMMGERNVQAWKEAQRELVEAPPSALR